jgi:hypothetical protein
MLKKYLLILIASTALMTTTGCSLFSSDTEEPEEVVSEETSVEEPGMESEETFADSEEEVVDEYPDDDYGDSPVVAGTDTTDEFSSDTTTDTTTDTYDTSSAATEDQLPDAPMENGTTDETLYVAGDTPMPDESSSYTSTTTSTTTIRDSNETTPSFIPVRKMKTTPYNDGNTLINRLYIVRDGDNMNSISTKVYGDDSRAKDLYKWNSHFKGKTLKVGDKVYYASARNPTDSSAMLLYYEEAGIQPSMYSAKKGESIRKVSQTLLGHPRSWMEVWATNDVESKWAMSEGTQLRYWPEGAAAGATPIMQANEEAAPVMDEASGAEDSGQNMAANEELPPPAEDMPMDEGSMAQNDENNLGNVAAAGSLEEPPPPSSDISTPPPPPPTAIAPPEAPAENGLASMMGGQDDSMMMAALGGLLILAALILLIFIKRSRKKVKYS